MVWQILKKNKKETKAITIKKERGNSIKSTIKPFLIFLILFMLSVLAFLSINLFRHEEIAIFLRGFMVFVIYGIYKFISSSSFFEVNEKGIKKGRLFYTYDEILRVDLYALVKGRFFLLSMPEEGIIIYLKNGKTISFKESYNTNFWKIRWFLDQKFHQGKDVSDFSLQTDYQHIEATHKSLPIPISAKIIRVLLIISITVFVVSLIDLAFFGFLKVPEFILLSLLSSFLLLITSSNSAYFERTDKHLIIKSVYLPFKKVIPVNHINSITKKKENKTIIYEIHTIYHKKIKVSMMNSKMKREEDSINKIKELDITFHNFT